MRSSLLRPAALAVLLAAWVPPAAAGEGDPAPAPRGEPEVRAGLLLPADPALSREVSRGAALAAERLSRSGGAVRILERRVEGPWGSEAGKLVALVYEDRVHGILTAPDRNGSHLAAQVTGKAHVPVLVGSPASALTRIPLPWMLQPVPAERRVLDALWAALPAGARGARALLFHGDDREGARTAGEAAAALRRAGAEAPRPFPCGASGEGREAGVASAGEARDAPVLLSLPAAAAATVLRDLRAAGWRGRALGIPPAGADPAAFAAALGNGGDGLLLARSFDPAAGEGASFRAAWRERYGGEPGEAAAAAHDAVLLLARAVRAGDGSPASVLEALRNGSPLAGATGTLSFDARGEREGTVAVVEARGGALHPLEPLQEKAKSRP